ncbi:MAG TPA: ABC transporter permease [Jiangellales bacterium]|nr:ABC transporter permease [Jiangellales bacterium]
MPVYAVLATIARNLRIAVRRPDLIIQTVAVPVVVLGLASIIFGATDAWPIAVVDDDRSVASERFKEALEDTEGVSGDYFRVVTADRATANDLVEQGRLQLVVRIPAGFADEHTIEITTYNINTDAMKNVRLRVVDTSNIFDSITGNQQISTVLRPVRPDSVSRTAFMGGSAVILALLLGAMLVAANLFAMEQEMRTTKELVLTPLSPAVGAIGAAGAAIVLAPFTAVPTLVMAWLFGLRADFANVGLAGTIVVPAMIAAAGAGVLVAQLLRTHRAIQPAVILAALATYFATGGFIPVPGLPPVARTFSAGWPPSYVFEWANPLVHGFASTTTPTQQVSVWLAAAVGVGLAAWAAVRERRRPTASGQ